MIKLVEKFPQSKKMSDQFYRSAHVWLENELSKSLQINSQLELTPMFGGIMGVTYGFTNSNTGEDLVIKVENFKDVGYSSYLAGKVCQENDIPFPVVVYFDVVEYEGVRLEIEITKKIRLPILAEYLQQEPENNIGIKQLGEVVRKLHSKTTENFGEFINRSFVGEKSNLNEYLSKVYLKDSFGDFYIKNKYLSERELDKLKSILNSSELLQQQQPVFCHGDIHLGNCFFNPHEGSVILFDYSSKSMPAIFDLAIYKHKVLSRGHEDWWEVFKEGYGVKNIDENLVDLIMAYLVFRKATIWKVKRSLWGIQFLRDFIEKS